VSIFVKGGRIIDPHQGTDYIGDLWLQDGIVQSLDEHMDVPLQAHVIDANGLVVCPGFIDVHCHLREPGDEDKETIATGTAAAARGGFTTVCAMPNTRPATDSSDMVFFVLGKSRDEAVVKVLPIACVTKGRDGKELIDMEEIAKAGAIGFSDDGSPVADDVLMHQALSKAATLGLPVINHCENPEISNGGVMNDGAVAVSLDLKGWSALAEEIMVARDIAMAETTGGPLHLAHISTAGSVELVRRAKKRGVSVTAEATPHHLTITEDWAMPRPGQQKPYNTNAKVNPPLRTQQDVNAVVQGLADGVIDCIATDHAPHTSADKDRTFEEAAFGISGFETALGSLLSLVHNGYLDMVTLVERLTVGPARVLNRPDLCPATLKLGSPADVTIFDPNSEWVVNAEAFVSKGKNTPLDGTTLKGRIVATVLEGNLVYESEATRID
jgi:dihydroorotase